MGRVYVCTNEDCDNNKDYDSPGTCPDCGSELEEEIRAIVEP